MKWPASSVITVEGKLHNLSELGNETEKQTNTYGKGSLVFWKRDPGTAHFLKRVCVLPFLSSENYSGIHLSKTKQRLDSH